MNEFDAVFEKDRSDEELSIGTKFTYKGRGYRATGFLKKLPLQQVAVREA